MIKSTLNNKHKDLHFTHPIPIKLRAAKIKYNKAGAQIPKPFLTEFAILYIYIINIINNFYIK